MSQGKEQGDLDFGDVGYEVGMPPHILAAMREKPVVSLATLEIEKPLIAQPSLLIENLPQPPLVGSVSNQVESSPIERSVLDHDAMVDRFKTAIRFEEHKPGMRLHAELLGGRYVERLFRGEKSGKREAASYGTGHLHGEEFVMYATNWRFMGGSTGVVAGEKFMEAIDMAIGRNLPFVGMYASGGMRQDENFAALEQLDRMIYGMEEFSQRSREINVAVCSQKTYGGVSVALSLADVVVGMQGTDFGFAGPNVIEGYEKKPVPEGGQSVEANYERRNIDFLVRSESELYRWTHNLLRHSRQSKHEKLTAEALEKPMLVKPLPDAVRFPFEQVGYASLISDEPVMKEGTEVALGNGNTLEVDYEDLFKRYTAHQKNPYRPDTEYILRQGFTDVVPFYMRKSNGKNRITYPAIIAALGKIGDQSFLIIGDQPSYQKIGSHISKIPSSPTPEDFAYLDRMMQLGRRLQIPLVLFTDTFGAKPTLESEERGQSRAIAEAIRAGIRYEPPVISINLGVLGSGGGLATTPRGDVRAMLEYTFGFVAEGRSSASITLRKPDPTDEEVGDHIVSMKATAKDLHEQGFVDDVIPEPGGAWKNPERATENVIHYVGNRTIILQEQSAKTRMKKRRRLLRDNPGLPIQHE